MKSIIWDWNGTLINDLNLICSVANQILARRGYQTHTVERVRELSCHPAQEWYRRMGVDFERHPFEHIVTEFHRDYSDRFNTAELHADSKSVLSDLRALGCSQYVLSAHMHTALVDNVSAHGISHYFDEILGLDSGHAHSKLENGQDLARRRKLNGNNAIMVGDSSHDAEVASVLGVPCFLVSRGLESESRLRKTGARVFSDLRAAINAAEVF